MKQYGLYIDGVWKNADQGAFFDVTNPANNEMVGQMADAGAKETRQAVDAAYRAFPDWSQKAAKERAVILERVYDKMIEQKEQMARLMTMEQGKPLAEAQGEVQYAADFFKWYAEEAKRIYGDTVPSSSPDKRIWVLRQPVGVTAAITPWNFPAAMITRKVAPALAAGCTMVVKPAEQTPLTAALSDGNHGSGGSTCGSCQLSDRDPCGYNRGGPAGRQAGTKDYLYRLHGSRKVVDEESCGYGQTD